MGEPNYIREPIALFRQIKEKKKSSDLLNYLKNTYPKKLKIGAAVKTGDCFFDSVAQVLNELKIKPNYHFTAKSLREDCAGYAGANRRPGSWFYEAVIKDAGVGGYFCELEGPYGPIQDPKTKRNVIDKEKTFNKYLEDIKNIATGAGPAPIWGRPGIEGRMICDKYNVELYFYSIEEDSKKVTVTKITENDDDPEVFIQGVNLDQLKIDNSKRTVGVVNYMRHFVPLLSGISEDITESQPVSSEEILGTSKEVPPSDQQEQKTQQEEIQKKLINNYGKEAIYGTVAVIAAVVFTPSAIATVLTQSIPFACLAGIALVVACVCVYQLTQSHKNINELKSELEENSTLTFLEEIGLKMHGLINKATLKI